MKKLLAFLVIMGMSFTLTSCSNKKVKKDDGLVQQEVAEEDLAIDDSDFIVDAEEEGVEEQSGEVADLQMDTASETSPLTIEGNETYEIQKGETLMWVAFKLYGDYRKWRELERMNQDVLADGVHAGDKIKYTPNQFTWNPQGLPHLIKAGETLGTISSEKYGTPAKWKSIWDNNRDQIKDPNLIFAGFTLYYIPSDREIASDNM